MKLRKIYYILAAGILTACSSDDLSSPAYTVGEADNAIQLFAGISQGGSTAQSRADADLHVPFSAQTQLRLCVEGTWLGKTPTTVTQYTNCHTSGADSKIDGAVYDLHPVAFDGTGEKKLYWDDYGTADPNNMPDVAGNGRAKGLDIYGVAVDGLSALPNDLKNIEGSSWTSLTWTVQTEGTDIDTKDIVCSKNLSGETSSSTAGTVGRYTFDYQKNGTAARLDFKHVLSKVTFRLKANDGFPTTGGVGVTTKKFEQTPTVILTGATKNSEVTSAAYAFTAGTIDIKNASATAGSTKAPVQLGGAIATDNEWTVIQHALVFPGTPFGTNDADNIAQITADGNIYYVKAKKIREAITAAVSSGHINEFKTMGGYNYIIDVTVNKTEIKVTATVTDWIDVKADVVAPTINITADWGTTTGSSTVDAFSFYRSENDNTNTGYSDGHTENAYYKAEANAYKPATPTEQWPFKTVETTPAATKLFWPNHHTHYQFRGVWPTTVTNIGDVSNPRVEALSPSDATQIIKVSNAAYTTSTFPSDLMIARPEFYDGEGNAIDPLCTNADHDKKNLYSVGICATEGVVKLNFRYMMSQVEVRLKTTDGTDKVNLIDAEVMIVNGFKDGYIKLGDRGAVGTTTGDYLLNELLAGDTTPRDGVNTTNIRHSAILPQSLTNSTNDLLFKVTIYNSGKGNPADKDIYYATIKDILVQEGTSPKGTISAWESGKHYIYTLDIRKTEVKVTATITDWTTVNANENVWF